MAILKYEAKVFYLIIYSFKGFNNTFRFELINPAKQNFILN